MSNISEPTRGVGWAFLFALRRESAPFERRFELCATIGRRPYLAQHGFIRAGANRLVVMETGIGAERAGAAARWVLEQCMPRLVVACGFAGALSPTLKIGDVLVASEVVEPAEDELHWRTAVPAEVGDLTVGRLLTAKRLVATPADKRSLARQTRAVAVDMESAAIAEACEQWRVPCAVVRAISDTADTRLSPRLVTLLSGGQVAPWRVLTALVRSPRLAIELCRLARDTRIAARRLGETLNKLIQ